MLSILSFVLSFGLIPGLLFSSDAGAANFAADSLIIPMDVTHQNYGMWKAYGLVFRLLQNGIPVNWAIGNPKTPDVFGGVDFTATTIDARTSAVIGSYNCANYQIMS